MSEKYNMFPVGFKRSDVKVDKDNTDTMQGEPYDKCPMCDSEPGSVTHQLAPNQCACTNGDCPIKTWVRKQSV